MGFPVRLVSSPNGSLGSAVAVVAGAPGAGAGVAGAAGVGVVASGLVAGAGGGVCDCCARDGCGPATVTAAAIPMQSAKRRNIKLSSVPTGAWRAALLVVLADFNPGPRVRPPPPKGLHATGACRPNPHISRLHSGFIMSTLANR